LSDIKEDYKVIYLAIEEMMTHKVSVLRKVVDTVLLKKESKAAQ
jgi:hypothetical protein